MPALIDTYDMTDEPMPVYEQMVAEKLVPREPVDLTTLLAWESWGYLDQAGTKHIFTGHDWVPLALGTWAPKHEEQQ